MAGGPPLNHPRRCQAKRRCGEQCKRWAIKTRRFCQFHGGRCAGKGRGIADLPSIYRKHLKGAIQKAVEAQLDSPPSEQLSLFEELALVRVTAAQVVALWGAAHETENAEAQIAASVLMRDALKDVISTCQAAAHIDAVAKDKFSLSAIHHIVNQIVRLAYEAFGDDPRAKDFEILINSKIKVPIEHTGTLLTPDQDVTDMDDTVPQE